MLLGIAATINVMAVDYTAKAVLKLEANSGYFCQLILRQADAFGTLNGAPMNMDDRHVALYALNGAQPLSIAMAADLTNLPLGLMCDTSESYTITVSGVEGAQTLVLFDLADPNDIKQYPLVNDAVIGFTAVAGSTIEDRFVINYVAPAPACTTIRENMEVGHYYTICIPQDIVSFNGASFWSMSNRGEGVAYLVEEAAPLTAGQPYIIQAEAEELCVVYGNAVPAPEAGTAGALVGTFELMEQEALNTAATDASSDIYLLYNNELWKVNGQSGNSLPANRAYVVYDNLIPENPASAPGRRVRAIPMQGQVATGIETLNAADAPAKTIIDGKLYIIRDKHMFDATGRMVK